MWVPKYVRDEKKGVDSPVPTQVVSNEELLPRPQHHLQKQVAALPLEMGGQQAKKLGMERRDFMRTAMGVATAWIAANKVYATLQPLIGVETAIKVRKSKTDGIGATNPEMQGNGMLEGLPIVTGSIGAVHNITTTFRCSDGVALIYATS